MRNRDNRKAGQPGATLQLLCTLALALPPVTAGASAIPGLNQSSETAASTEAAVAVPDPARLRAGWWDYLAPDKPGARDRVRLLLDKANSAAAALDTVNTAEAAQVIERLRISLTALPDMLEAQPAPLPEIPAAREAYTTTEILDLDSQVRALQQELEERRSAINVAQRAIRNGQAQTDTAFAAYLGSPGNAPARALTALQIMATRAEVAVMQAEVGLREREIAAIKERIGAMRALRDAGRARIVADPARDPAKIASLIDKNKKKLEAQRSEILRERARRSELATAADPEDVSLADLRMLSALIEEGLLVLRISLYETELDWLAITGTGDGQAELSVADIESRLAQRRIAIADSEKDAADWTAEAQRLIRGTLRRAAVSSDTGQSLAGNAMIESGSKTISRLARLRNLQSELRFAIVVTGDLLDESSGWRGKWRKGVIQPAMAVAARAHQLLGTGLFTVGGAPVTAYGLLRILLIMAIAIGISRLATRLLQRFAARQTGTASSGYYTVGRLLHYVLISAGLLIGLSSIGLDFSQLALLAGALSIGIGFGLQSIVNNFVSGLIILFEQSLKVGDFVELDSGVRGTVREISVRSALISTADNIDIIVPNSEFVSGKVINLTLREPYHRIHVPFGVAYGSDKDQVRAVVLEAAGRIPFTHVEPHRAPDVWLVGLGDNSLNFELVVWINPAAVKKPGSVMATYLWEIESVLRAHGIEIPFPQRDVHLKLTAAESPLPGTTVGRTGPAV